MPNKSPPDSQKLAALIAEAKSGKTRKSDMLEPYRAILMKERKAGTSVRIMAESLRVLGVTVSEESLRLWFVRQAAPKGKRVGIVIPTVAKIAKTTQQASPTAASTGPRVARANI